jgi:hypothetical protein
LFTFADILATLMPLPSSMAMAMAMAMAMVVQLARLRT